MTNYLNSQLPNDDEMREALALLNTIGPDELAANIARIAEHAATTGDAPFDTLADTPAPLPPQHIRQTAFDSHLYQTSAEQTPLGAFVDEQTPRYALTDALARDVYATLYKSFPETQANAPEYQQAAEALDALLATNDYQQLHQWTQLDETSAAIGAATLARYLIDDLAKRAEQEAEQQAEQAAAQQQPQDGESGSDGDPASGGDQPGAEDGADSAPPDPQQ
ncbi:MAG: hypothetical protein KGK07_16990, partial [Chloroflexota bacterium]|nr:hypothetical protein [Chloroflexota bacterium]